jgi:hypothetical protein
MSSQLLDTLLADIKEAMKAREMEKVTALRGLHAQIKDAGTNAGKEEDDELVASVIARAIKQRHQSIEQYREAGREDLAEVEQQEIDWIKVYQPEQMDEAEIEAIVSKAIADTGAEGKQDMGKVMGAVMPQVKGKADGKLVNAVVQKLLA